MLASDIWHYCLENLQDEIPAQQFQTWIRPLRVGDSDSDGSLLLFAPNRFIRDWVADRYRSRIEQLISESSGGRFSRLQVDTSTLAAVPTSAVPVQLMAATGSQPAFRSRPVRAQESVAVRVAETLPAPAPVPERQLFQPGKLNPEYTFENFVEGTSNRMALAAAIEVAEKPGGAYNPFFLYGGSGLGKTHLLHAIGHSLLQKNPSSRVAYWSAESFVSLYLQLIKINSTDEFKRYFRTLDALLIDDIQFLAGKERSQEEFFYSFNTLLEGSRQVILTCDRYPRELTGIGNRLQSRFGWGLTVSIEPPELETRAAILMKKAELSKIRLPNDAAMFLAQRLRNASVRELEGALKTVIASASFKGRLIDIDLVKESLKDLLSAQDRLVSIDNIQKTVAEYYKIKVSDLSSKRRSRSIARPRQVAMALAKELTSKSLPEIGEAFGGKDHTTVMHACRKIEELKESNSDIKEDVKNLLRILTT